MSEIVQQIAAKALIVGRDGRVLLLQESSRHGNTHAGRFGLAGGRLDIGESYNDALLREVKEETGLHVTIGDPLYLGEWRPVIDGVTCQIVAIFSICYATSSEVVVSDEHTSHRWICGSEVGQIDFMPPDDEVVKKYFTLMEK